MPIRYSVEPERGLVRLELADPLDPAHIALTVERLLADPELRVGLDLLSDHSQLDFTATTELVRAIPALLDRLGARLGRFRCAVVVPRDASYGMARMAEVLSEGGMAQVRAFRSAEEAEGWLAVAPARRDVREPGS